MSICRPILFGVLALGVVSMAGCAADRPASDTEHRIRAILLEQVALYPAMQEQDVYKLLHQAALGPAHATLDRVAARQWMEREVEALKARNGLEPADAEPLVEQIDPSGQLVRVNLRPFLAAGGDPTELADAFAETANQFSQSPAVLTEYLEAAVRALSGGMGGIDTDRLDEFATEQAAAGYPAVHHSPEYGVAHIPAYRVVLRELVP